LGAAGAAGAAALFLAVVDFFVVVDFVLFFAPVDFVFAFGAVLLDDVESRSAAALCAARGVAAIRSAARAARAGRRGIATAGRE
jgi:hypothetical protein